MSSDIFNITDDEKMQRVVYVKEPFHKFAYVTAAAPFSVIHHNNRYRKDNSHLHNSVELIKCKEIHNGIY